MRYSKLIYNHLVRKLYKLDGRYYNAIRLLGRRPRRLDKNGCYVVKTKIGDVLVRPGSSDIDVLYQIAYLEEYKYSVEIYDRFFQQPPIWVVDLGANIGLATRYLKTKYEGARFLCMEPDSGNIAILRLNMRGIKNIFIEPCAVWPFRERLHLSNDFRDGRDWSIRVVKDNGADVSPGVEGIPLVQILHKYEIDIIDILKIDIEGAEREVVFEDKNFVNVLERTKYLVIEVHPEFVSRVDAQLYLESNGFKVFSWGETMNAVNTVFLTEAHIDSDD